MGIDLKVPVRNFNCESRACYVGTLAKAFFPSSRKIFSQEFRESCVLRIIIIVYITAC